MEENVVLTPHFATGILSALLALSGTPTHTNSVHEDPPAIIFIHNR